MRKFITFFIFVSSLYILIHIYVAYFLTKFFGDKYKLRYVFLLIALFSIFSVFLRRFLYNNIVSHIYFVSFLWMGTVFLAAFIFLFFDLFHRLIGFEFKKIFMLSTMILLLLFAYSLYKGFAPPKVKDIEFYSSLLDRDYSFYFISDVHLDFRFKNLFFKKVFEMVNTSDVDFVIIGGDLFDPGFEFEKFMEKISKKPVFFVNGNHEYYFGIEKAEYYLDLMGFLNITSKSVEYGKINIIGLDDIKTAQLSLKSVRDFISKKYKDGFLNLIVSHQPLYFEDLAKDYNFIMLSGHTHCGQVFPFHFFTMLVYKYFCGEYSFNNSRLYVSSGVGVWGPHMRLLSESEVLKITIKKV